MKGKKIASILFSIIILLAAIGMVIINLNWQEKSFDTLLLLTPDQNTDPILLEAWKNIAAEEGLHLEVQLDSVFLNLRKQKNREEYSGIILADNIHSKVSPKLAETLKAYVASGGNLMLIYDAGSQDMKGNFYQNGSIFSDILNLSYFPNPNGPGSQTQVSSIGHNKEILESLGIPPGKYIPIPGATLQNTSGQPSSQASSIEPSPQNTDSIKNDPFNAISTYGYGVMNYPHFITKTIDKNFPLLLTTPDHQFIAGTIDYGKGKILFINLPITQLWLGTDSMPLHVFLNYFATNMLHLPVLSSVPNGVGGIIMNLHVESKEDLSTFPALKEINLFDHGPYSIDFTAGPDQDTVGDNMGPDILHNPIAQEWLNYFIKLGHTIGSDGGWIHNYFGLNVSETNQDEFQKYITMNIDAIEKVTNKRVLEYVPSMGNQPNWATRYLEKRGFLGYYSLSNTGVGPTQNFRDGVFDEPFLWSYPVLPYGQYACFRDFGFAKLPVESVSEWVTQCTEFVASRHTARLLYYHPSDLLYFPQYLDSIKKWLLTAKTLSNKGAFQWYSMVSLAKFLNVRRDVSWIVKKKWNSQIIHATHPITLQGQTWLINKDVYDTPEVTLGKGIIHEDEWNWIITAEDVNEFEFQYTKR